jgi:hypothetical protein
MSSPDERKKIVEEKLQETEDLLQSDKEQIPDRIYSALEGISSTLLAWKQTGGKAGWSSSLVDRKGHSLFTREEQQEVERLATTAEPILESLFTNGLFMAGGATMTNLKQSASGGDLVKMPSIVSADNISMDKLYYGLLGKLDEYDRQWRDIVNQIGIVKTIESSDAKGIITIPFVPPIPVPYVIPARAKLPILNTILEMLRIMVSNTVFDAPNFRILLSFVLAILDLLRGEWKHALLSALGAYSVTAMWIGLGGKVVRDAWLLISPDLQHQLQKTLYKSSKSMFAGFFLWGFSVFSPDVIRMSVETATGKMREVIANFNEKITGVEQQAKSVANPLGIDVSFQRIPDTLVPSFDDIQNLQTLVKVPEVYCSTEFQAILKPLLLVPPLRLALELFNIPTVQDEIDEECKGKTSSLSDTLAEKATPIVKPLETAPSVSASPDTPSQEDPQAPAASSTPPASVPAKGGSVRKRKTRKARRFSSIK